jgi:Tol biopolymer transport system component
MNHDSAEAHFHLQPAVAGAITWNGTTMTFRPTVALKPGSSYTVYLEPGAQSETGRTLLSEYRYSFTIARPRVAYLFPADGTPQNIWMVDPANPDQPKQITDSPTGIQDFGVSPDGTKIAFTEINPVLQTSDLKLIDLESGALEQLTNCQNALCSAPVWRPDGKVIAYERIENDAQFGNSPPRIWLLDMTTSPASTRPLFQENQILGYQAQWSADGSRIALVDRGSASILVYDFATDKIVSIASQSGTSGALSPDGRTLIYPDIVFDPSGGARNTMRIATIDTGEFATLTDPSDPVDDQRVQFSPDGSQIAVARKDYRVARGAQIVLVNPQTDATTPLTTDPRYSNVFFWWDPTGTEIVAQRFPELDENMQTNPTGRPEIWTFDLTAGTQTKVATNGFLPQWVP